MLSTEDKLGVADDDSAIENCKGDDGKPCENVVEKLKSNDETEPLQVQLIDSSEGKATKNVEPAKECKIVSNGGKSSNSNKNRFLISIASSGLKFIVPHNLFAKSISSDDDFLCSLPVGLREILPDVINRASSAIFDQNASKKFPQAGSSLSIEVSSLSTSNEFSSALSRISLQLDPLDPFEVSTSQANVVGNVSESKKDSTYLITFDDDKKTVNVSTEGVDNSLGDAEKSRDSVESAEVDNSQNKNKPARGRKKKRGRKAEVNCNADEQAADRLICKLCPIPSVEASETSSLEWNCNEVGPTYGIRITQNVSRCFVCTTELKSMKDVKCHADTEDHRTKLHLMLTNQTRRRKGIPVRHNTNKESSGCDDKGCTSAKTASSGSSKEPLDENETKTGEDGGLDMPNLTEEKHRIKRKCAVTNSLPNYNRTTKRKRSSSETSCSSIPVLEKVSFNSNTCPVCELEFEDVVQKLDHALKEHEEYKKVLAVVASAVHSAKEDERLFACTVCKKVYNGVENLLSHLIAAHRVKPRLLENVESAKDVVAELISKKQKTPFGEENSQEATKAVEEPLSEIKSDSSLDLKCVYCSRSYTTPNRLQRHYKLTGHKKIFFVKRARDKKKCDFCGVSFRTAIARKGHLESTIPDANGGPCNPKPDSDDADSKKSIVRVPGGGIVATTPVKSNLTCQNCSEAFSTVQTFQLHSRITSPTKGGCIPMTPSFKAGGAKPLVPSEAAQNTSCNLFGGDKSEAGDEIRIKIEPLSANENISVESKMEVQPMTSGELKSVDASSELSKQCKFCLKVFNSSYSRQMHQRITIPDEDLKICSRKFRKRTMHTPRIGMKKKRPKKQQADSVSPLEDGDLALEEPLKTDIKTEIDSPDYDCVVQKNDLPDSFMVEKTEAELVPEKSEVTPKVIRAKHGKNDCTCRVCLKVLSTPWNRNAHERKVHEYDHKLGNQNSPTIILPPDHLEAREVCRCISCKAEFDNTLLLDEHYKVTKHDKDAAVQDILCKYCDKKFATEASRNGHYKNTIPIVSIGKCVITNNIKPHQVGPANKTVCNICGKNFKSAIERVKHENVAHRKFLVRKFNKFKPKSKSSSSVSNGATLNKSCKMCNNAFGSASQLQMHYATFHHGKILLQEVNKSPSPNRSLLKAADKPGATSIVVENPSSPDEKFRVERTCRFCYRVFGKVWNKKVHEISVHKATDFDDSIQCDSKANDITIRPISTSESNFSPTPQKSSLSIIPVQKESSLSKSDASSPAHRCNQCRRAYSSEERLLKHYEVSNHNVVLKNVIPGQTCTFCNKTFKSTRALKIHLRVTVPNPAEGTCLYRVGLEMIESQKSAPEDPNPLSKTCKHCLREFSSYWHRRVHEVRSHPELKDGKPGERVQFRNILPKSKSKSSLSKTKNVSVYPKKPKYCIRNDNGDIETLDNDMMSKLCRICYKVFTTVWYMKAHVKKNHPTMADQHFSRDFCDDPSIDVVMCTLSTPRNLPSGNSCSSSRSIGGGIQNKTLSPIKSPAFSPIISNLVSLNPSSNDSELVSRKKCKICLRNFKWNSALQDHEKTCQLEMLAFKCRICGVMFRERRQLGPHWRKHRQSHDFNGCSPSHEMFITLDKPGVLPSEGSASKSSHTARMQGREVRMPNNSPINSQDSKGGGPGGKHLECYRCAGCNKIFMNAVKFIQHRLTHFSESSVTEISDKKPFCCEVCNMVLEHHTLVQVHLLEHLRVEKRKSCYVHNKVLKPGMMVDNLPNDEPPIPQSTDNKNKDATTTTKAKPRPYRKLTGKAIPKNGRRYLCRFCNRTFLNISKYLSHKNLSLCQAKQELKDRVWRDMKRVQETGKFTDDLDVKEDADENYVNENYQMPTESLDNCRFCSKEFADAKSRQQHELDECDETSLCKICDSKFDSPLLAITHFDLHHPSKDFRCTPCDTTFQSFDTMEDHVLSHHLNDRVSPRKLGTPNDIEKKLSFDSDHEHFSTTIEIINHDDIAAVENNVLNLSLHSSGKEAELELETNFTKLLGSLIGDEAVLIEIGWKKRPICRVLEDVMQRTGIDTIQKNDIRSELQCLRENIYLMLSASLEDSVQETVGLGKESIDEVVKEMLKLSEDD